MDSKLQNFVSQIHAIKMKFFQNQDKINLETFSQLLHEIQQYDATLSVTEENSQEIFQMLDHDYDGYLCLSEIDQLLNTILPVYEESLNPVESNDNSNNRGSLYFDSVQKKFTYARIQNKDGDKRKIGSSLLNTLSLDKLSELKYIYHMADRENKGFAEFSRIQNIGREISNQLTLNPNEIESLFIAFVDETSNKVSLEIFSKLLSELEKRIFNYFNDQESTQAPSLEKQQTNFDLMIQDSDSDNEANEEYQIKEIYSTISAKYISLLVQKLEEAFGLKIKNQFLTNILQDLRKVIKSLENKLLHAEERIDAFIQTYQEGKNNQDMTLTKMKAFEFDLKRQIIISESLEDEISKMDLEIKRLENKANGLEKSNQHLSKRNQEIDILENRIRSLLKENQELKQKNSTLTNEKNRALENYQLVVQIANEKSEFSTEFSPSDSLKDASKVLEDKLKKTEKNLETLETLYRVKEKELSIVVNEKEILEKELHDLKIEFEQNDTVIVTTKNELRELKETYDSLKEDYDLKLEYLQNRIKSPELSERKSSFTQAFTLNKDLKGSDFSSIFNERTSLYSKFHKSPLTMIDEKGEFDNEEHKSNDLNPDIYDKNIKENKIFVENKDKKVNDPNIASIDIKSGNEIIKLNTEKNENNNIKPNSDTNIKTTNEKLVDNVAIKKIEEKEIKKKVENPFFEKIETKTDTIKETKGISIAKGNLDKNPITENKKMTEENKEISSNPEKKNITATQHEYTFLKFDEASLFARDYLSMREDPRIIEILKKNNEDMLNFTCFSDYMFRINHREHKEKRILFITARALYNIHPKRFDVLRRVPVEKIYKTSISDKSAILMAIHFRNEYDYLIETYRRADMVLYLMEIFKKRSLPMFERVFGPQFTIKNRGSDIAKPITQYDQTKSNVGMQELYKNSMKLGLLEMQRNSWWNPWKEYFFVLTKDVGLMVFRKQGDSNTRNIIKIVGSLIVENPSSIEKPFALKIVYPENNEEYILAAHSFAEKSEWVEAFQKFTKEASKKKAQLV